MKTTAPISAIIILIFTISIATGQNHVDVEGRAEVTIMDNVNSADSVNERLADGILSVQDKSTRTYKLADSVDTQDEATNAVEDISEANVNVLIDLLYVENFESGLGSWSIGGSDPSWECGVPMNTFIDTAATDTNACVTNLTGHYNNNEMSYLISPFIDFTGIVGNPVVDFALIYQLENGFDKAWLEISTDDGNNWSKVGAAGTGINWYNDAANNWWTNNSGGWIDANHELTGVAGSSGQFRFVMSSDGSSTQEGIGLDRFSITLPPPICVVTNTNDNGLGSLRDGIDCVTSGDTLFFDVSMVDDTISIDSAIIIVKDVIVYATPGQNIWIDGSSLSNTLKIMTGASVEIVGIKVYGGNGPEGVLWNQGNLILDNVQVYGDGSSGAIFSNEGVLVMKSSSSILLTPL